jgi:hypothetical protein
LSSLKVFCTSAGSGSELQSAGQFTCVSTSPHTPSPQHGGSDGGGDDDDDDDSTIAVKPRWTAA